MNSARGRFSISDDSELLDVDVVVRFLQSAYWSTDRSRDAIERSIEGSLCFGLYDDGKTIGFARIVTDFATIFYLCDVFVDESYRGRGLGVWLVRTVLEDPRLEGLGGMLRTSTAHSLYERFGFERDGEIAMRRPADYRAKK